jgi:mono/diheme cytochrome c family protein
MHGMARGGFGGGSVNRADGRVLAFRLGGTATLPPLAESVAPAPPPPMPAVGRDVIELGNAAYHRVCAGCHGMRGVGGGIIPDLRHMSAGTHAEFDDIVLNGSRTDRGMIGFGDVITADEAEAIRAYVILRANEDWAGD